MSGHDGLGTCASCQRALLCFGGGSCFGVPKAARSKGQKTCALDLCDLGGVERRQRSHSRRSTCLSGSSGGYAHSGRSVHSTLLEGRLRPRICSVGTSERAAVSLQHNRALFGGRLNLAIRFLLVSAEVWAVCRGTSAVGHIPALHFRCDSELHRRHSVWRKGRF